MVRAARLTAHGLDGLRVEDVAAPEPAAGEVLVAVETVGVNQLDLNLIAGVGPGAAVRLPRTLGLDPAGTIMAVGTGVDPARVGERVVVKPNVPCGACTWCARGREADCPAQTVIGGHRDGGAAELVTVPERNAVDRRDLDAAIASAAVHSVPIVLNALETAGVAAGERVLVTGASGTLGQVAVQLARYLGAEVVAASRQPLDLWPDVTTLRASSPDDLASEFARALPDGVDVSLDVSGHAGMLAAGVGALRWGGRAVFCSASVETSLELDARAFYLRRLRLIGVASADHAQVRRGMDLVADGVVRPPIARRYPLDRIADAYREFGEHRTGKVIVDVA